MHIVVSHESWRLVGQNTPVLPPKNRTTPVRPGQIPIPSIKRIRGWVQLSMNANYTNYRNASFMFVPYPFSLLGNSWRIKRTTSH